MAVQTALHVLTDIPKEDEPSLEAVDIVLVHGLNFRNKPNHAWDTWTLNGKLWPRDFLPDSLSRPARVMLFEYNSSPVFDSAAIDLVDHARNLLHWLDLKRKDSPERRLVFICHSLGGLVVKEALVEAHLDPSYESVKKTTCLVVFFATPHRGGNFANLGDVVGKIVSIGARSGSNNLLETLKKNSNDATRRFEQFRSLYGKYLFVSFFEGLPYGKLGLIVPKASAILNLAGTNEKQVAMDADHSSICKFDSVENPACELVLSTIKAELERTLQLNLGDAADNNRTLRISDLNNEDRACLRALYEVTGEYESQQSEIDTRVKGTCTWVLQDERYTRWLSTAGPSLLWITGNPGCGKSVLAGFLVDELASTQPQALVRPFFFRSGHERRTKSHQALCALLHSIFTAKPNLVQYARDQFAAKGGHFAMAPGQLWKILCTVSEKLPQPLQVICVIDALDECERESRDVLIRDLVSTFSSQTSNPFNGPLKVLVTSRPLPEIEQGFHPMSEIRLKAEDDTDNLFRDIKEFIHSRVAELRANNILSARICQMVTEKLDSGADGTFLWASLVLKSVVQLDSKKKSTVEAALAKTPSDLDALYDSAFSAANKRSRQLLQCVLAATRPLSLLEINVALGMEEDVKSPEELDDELESNIEDTVKRLGGFFVRVIHSHVHLVHQTARDFLLGNATISQNLESRNPFLDLIGCHLVLADRCVRFLTLCDWLACGTRWFDIEPFSGKMEPRYGEFYAYAARYWFIHAREGGVDVQSGPEARNVDLVNGIHKLCDRNRGYLRVWSRDAGFFADHPLHDAVEHGNLTLLQYFLALGGFCVTELVDEHDVLAHAAGHGRGEICRWILEKYGGLDLQKNVALVYSLVNGNTGLMEALLECNLDLNVRSRVRIGFDWGSRSFTPLEAAIFRHWPVPTLDLLVEKGAEALDPAAFDQAILAGRWDALRWLLDQCKNTASRDEMRTTKVLTSALGTAAKSGKLDMMDLIQAEAPNVTVPKTCDFRSGLENAAERGDTNNLSRLLAMGIRDDHSGHLSLDSPLQRCIMQPETVSLLLDHHSYTVVQLENAVRILAGRNRVAAIWSRLRSYADASVDDYQGRLPSLVRQDRSDLSFLHLVHAQFPDTPRAQIRNSMKCFRILLQLCCPDPEKRALGHYVSSLGSQTKEWLAQNLNLVCLCGYPEVAQLLVTEGAEVTQKGRYGISPLLAAVIQGNIALINDLVAQGADPDELCHINTSTDSLEAEVVPEAEMPDTDGEAVVSPDVLNNSWMLVRSALGADPLIETPICLAQWWANGKFCLPVTEILKRPGKTNNSDALRELRSIIKRGAEHGARYIRHPAQNVEQRVRDALQANPLFVHTKGHGGLTLLHTAAAHGSSSFLQAIIDGGANLSVTDKDGRTPLHAAVTKLQIENARILVERGGLSLLGARDHDARTCLDASLRAGGYNMAKALVDLGAPLLEPWKDGQLPLHHAVYGAIRSGDSTIVTYIWDRTIEAAAPGSNRTYQDCEGRNLLHHVVLATAAWKPSFPRKSCIGPELIKDLISNKGVDHQHVDIRGDTPLAHAERYTRHNSNLDPLDHQHVGIWGDTPLVFGERHRRHDPRLDPLANEAIKLICGLLQHVPSWDKMNLDQDKIKEFYERCEAAARQKEVGDGGVTEAQNRLELSGDEYDEEPWNASEDDEPEGKTHITSLPVVRTLSCPADAPFYALHLALQSAFGWAETHGFDFAVMDPAYREPENSLMMLIEQTRMMAGKEVGAMGNHEGMAREYELRVTDPVAEEVGAKGSMMGGVDRMHEGRRRHPRTVERRGDVTALWEVLEDREYQGKQMVYTYDFGDNWEHYMNVETRTSPTHDFICLSGTGHPAAEDVHGYQGWEELKAAYRTQQPNEDQREKREWFENEASNGDPRGLAGNLVNEWDMDHVNEELRELLPRLEHMANQSGSTPRDLMREHILRESGKDIKRLWKD